MKIVKLLLLVAILFSVSISNAADYTDKTEFEDNTKPVITVYYFHTNARCVTCRTIEAEARKDLQELFDKKVNFVALNLDEDAGKTKAKELGVNVQTLLIVKGENKINITNQGFLYARSNPEKFKQVIEDKIKPLL